jgi:predicted KAP-like P-loop ATPase
MEFRYLPDLHIESEKDDYLDFAQMASLTVAAIKNSVPPFTWGIYGDWGSGKTSLMNLMKIRMEDDLRQLKKAPPGPILIPVWFDAWRYENEVNIIYPLFYAIRQSFAERFPADTNNKDFLESFKRVAITSLFGLTDLALRAATKAAFGDALKIKDLKESFETVEEDLETVFSKWTDQVTEVRDAFENFVAQYLKVFREKHSIAAKREVYLAVFIDDLDRCLPDVAIEILERIKNHLISNRCVFILGINRNVVYKSIKKKYGDLEIDGRQHLEKIIQYSVGVPRPSKKAIVRFGIERLKALVISTDKQDLDSYFKAFSETLYESHFTNPRKIKRIMNTYLNFVMKHIQVHGDIDEFNLPTIIRLIILREYYQDFHDLFREEGFEPFKIISAHSSSTKSDFVKSYGHRWQYLVSQLDRMKDLASMSPGDQKSVNQYRDAIDELFGLED